MNLLKHDDLHTRSRRTRGVMTFSLQLVNQHDALVQTAEIDMMLPRASQA